MAAEFVERRIQSTGSLTNFNIDRTQSFIDVDVRGQRTRIYGTQQQLDEYQNKRPDGTTPSREPAQTLVRRGRVETTESRDGSATGAFDAQRATVVMDQIRESVRQANAEANIQKAMHFTRGGAHLPNIVPNPMERFASYSVLWTLAVLTPEQYNNPSVYRTDDLSFAGQTQRVRSTDVGEFDMDYTYKNLKSSIIFSSAGRDFIDKNGNSSRTSTAYGTPEYYIDDFEMKAVISASEKTGNTNAIGFSFKIYEPFSMGLLLQSLQVAALNAGYLNYLDSPFLLRMDFKGFAENTQQITSMKPKYFVMKLKTVKFEVDESGSTYEVEAFPFNHQAYSDTVNTIWQNFSIAPRQFGLGTVEEALITSDTSLTKVLNDNERANVDAGKYSIPDIYEIQFPEKSSDWIPNTATTFDRGATMTPGENTLPSIGSSQATTRSDFGTNPIGQANFGFSQSSGGNFPFSKEGDTIDEATGRIVRGRMSIDPTNRRFHFTQGQSITDVIVQTILSSTYARDAISRPENLTPEGFIRWFRLDIQMEMLDYDDTIGDFAKKYTFRIVPFFVHHTIFSNPTTAPIGYDELQKQIVKKYEYIYSGQNNEILKFDIEINNLFYTGTNSSAEGNTESEQNQNQQGIVEENPTQVSTSNGGSPEAAAGNLPKSKIRRDPSLFNIRRGGVGYSDVERKVAENFHEAFIKGSSTDLVQVDLEILGDPYWMVDSGMANYFSEETDQSKFVTEDGSANYEGSDVYIYLTFRTPSDINPTTGLNDFPDDRESPFSGIYKVVRCTSSFNDGKFTQELRCLRMQGQVLDYDGFQPPVNVQDSLTNTFGGESPPRAEPAVPPAPAPTNTVESFEQFGRSLAESFGIDLSQAGPPAPQQPAEPEILIRRRQSNGTLVNFNIDKTKPFVDETRPDGTIVRIFES